MTLLPVVIFDDIELWTTTTLRAAITARTEAYTDNVFVSNKVPNPRRDRMVIVRRDGGPRLDVAREAARIGVRVWALTDQDATDLARLVAALLWAAPDGDPVCKVTQMLGPTWTADESGASLLYSTYELIVKGRDL